MNDKILKNNIMNFICIIFSIVLIYFLHKLPGMLNYKITHMVNTAAAYTAYILFAKKFLSGSKPVLWIVTFIVADLAIGFSYLCNIRVILMFITGTWLICMIVYFIEWLMMSKEELINRRFEFKKIVLVAVILFFAYASIDSYLTFTTTTHRSDMAFITIFLIFGGYKVLNAFGGISNGECREDLGSSRQGDKYITYFQRLTGDEAVLFGIRSAMIWLSLGALWINMSPFFMK